MTLLGVVFLFMLVNWWVEKRQRFLFNVYKRFFLFWSRFFTFFNVFFIFFSNVFTSMAFGSMQIVLTLTFTYEVSS